MEIIEEHDGQILLKTDNDGPWVRSTSDLETRSSIKFWKGQIRKKKVDPRIEKIRFVVGKAINALGLDNFYSLDAVSIVNSGCCEYCQRTS